jgi:hypothetical protein
MNADRALGLLAFAVAAAADGGAIAITQRTDCGESSAVPSITLAVVGGLVAGGLLFAALRSRGSVRAAVAAVVLAFVVSIVGAFAVLAQGLGCLN